MIQVLRKHGFVYDQLPAILWAVLIFIASSIPGVDLPKIEFVASDKLIHFLEYLVLSALLYRALRYQRRFLKLSNRSLRWCVLLSIAYGASDEFHQSLVAYRDASVYDLIADTAGAFSLAAFLSIRECLAKKGVFDFPT